MYNFYYKNRKSKIAGFLYKARLKSLTKLLVKIMFLPKVFYLYIKSHFSSRINGACESIIYIPPKDINKKPVSSVNFNLRQEIKKRTLFKFQVICSEDWQANIKSFEIENTPFYRAAHNVFYKNDKWEEQELYKKQLDLIKKRIPRAGCITEKCLNKKYNYYWSGLFNTIKTNGYLSQKTLNKKCSDEIRVAISEYGDFLFLDGRHRLTYAKLLDIPEIPVFVVAVHENYYKRYLEKF